MPRIWPVSKIIDKQLVCKLSTCQRRERSIQHEKGLRGLAGGIQEWVIFFDSFYNAGGMISESIKMPVG